VGSGGSITLISSPQDNRATFAQINNLSTVAFKYSLFFGAGTGVSLGTGGTTTTIIDQTGPYSDFRTPGLNDSNVVAVGAKRDAGGWDVLRINGATVDVVAGPFQESSDLVFGTLLGVYDVGINNIGDVAFLAQLAPSTFGILTGPDPVADKVIRDGDTLFGSAVTDLFFNTGPEFDGPNDAGQIVFRYGLADGRSGIALATPINPMLDGDFNCDGAVDAADYVTWRKDGGTQDDLSVWRANFGQSTGSGAAAHSLPAIQGVPEPNSLALLCAAAALVWGANVAGTLRVPCRPH
jgi:hypothetical protein